MSFHSPEVFSKQYHENRYPTENQPTYHISCSISFNIGPQKPLPTEKSNIIYEKYHLSVAIEMKCVSIESDDWARNAEQLLSLIVSKTIAYVNKMRVNRLTKRIRDVDKISKCIILKPIPFLVGFAECQPYFRRCNYLGFRITYAKIAPLCIYSCMCVCFVLPENNKILLALTNSTQFQPIEA